MAHVRFLKNYDYRPPGTLASIAYKADWSGTVKKDCADKAIAAKAAVRIKPPRLVQEAPEDA